MSRFSTPVHLLSGIPAKACVALLLTSLALLSGCGSSAPPATPATPAATARPADAATGFALISASGESFEGRPALLLEFSQPLAGAQKFDELAQVTGAKGEAVTGSWVLDEDGKRLRFPYLDADKTYKVVLKGELSAADGKTLAKTESREIYTGPLAPAIGFASQGSVLPAKDSQGLPIVTVNVTEVDVEFLRVKENSLSSFFANYQRNGERSYWQLDDLERFADPVYANRFALEAKPNERTLTYIPTQDIDELDAPGLYFATMKRPGVFKGGYETCFFFVSDIGLHVRLHGPKLWLHTASLKTGAALAGVDIEVLDNAGTKVMSAETDAEGNAEVDYELKTDQVLIARNGSDVSLLPFNQPALDLSDFEVAGRRQDWYEVFAWSSRDLYRPGETVRVSALLRDHDGKPIKAQPVHATLLQPDGRRFGTQILAPGELGYIEWTRTLPGDVPTGRWQLEFRLDPAKAETAHRYAFRVEEFLPERLKLELTSAQERLAPGDVLSLVADADYLYGAPAAGNRFTARLTLAADQHPVESHKDYFFGDPLIELPEEAEDVIDGVFDAEGHFEDDIAILAEVTPTAPVAAIVSGSVYETGGRTVTRSLKRTLWPADVLVGVRPLFDPEEGAASNADAGFEVIRSDASGKLMSATGLKVKLQREQRDYHWTYESGSGWRVDYAQRFEETEVLDLPIEAGKAARLDLRVEWGDYRLEVLDPESGLTMRYPFRAGWGWEDENRGLEARPDKVKVSLDKESYRVGDKLKVTITPPHPGPGLLLVETDKLIQQIAINATPSAVFELPVSADWDRHDVYITAVVFRPGSSSERITPNRAVGVVHVPMDRSERRVKLEIAAPELTAPGQELVVVLKAPALAGQKAAVTIAATDLGILNITRFALPDAADYFFAQRALGVDAYDLYGRVIESRAGGRARLRFGGDAALISALPQARRPTAKVQTVDLFSGAVALDASGSATIRLMMPDFNGTLRVAALVYGETNYGAASTDTIVRAPLVAEVSTPRVMAPDDKSWLTLDLQNFSGSEREFKVEVQAERPIRVKDGKRKVTLADKAKTTLTFPLEAVDDIGVGRFKVSAESGDLQLVREFEITVRPAWPTIRRSKARVLEAGGDVVLDSRLLSGLLPASVNARLSVSTLPPLPFATAVKGLIDYPYGCLEQTSSRAYPLVWLDEATARTFGLPVLSEEKRRAMLDDAFARLTSFQLESGHFSMWGGDGYSNTLLTPYVAELLINARDTGLAVPEATLQKSLERINESLLSGGNAYYEYENSDHMRFADQAYSGYVLARVGRAPLGTLRALYDNQSEKAVVGLPLVHLGIALALQGDKSRGEKAIKQAFEKEWKRPWYLGDYGSDLRDLALMLALTHEHNLAKPEYDARIFELARTYMAESRERWAYLSTQEQVAVFRLGRALLKSNPGNVTGTLVTGGVSEALPASAAFSREFDAQALRAGVRLRATSEGTLYVSEDVAGVPRGAPEVDLSQVDIKRAYYGMDGKPFAGGPLKEGDSLIAALSIEPKESMPDALLVDLLPGGLEIENLNLTDAEQWTSVVIDGITLSDRGYAADIRHEEFRDDRYVAALNLSKGSTAHLFYMLRAVSPGDFAVPPPMVEDMYRPEMRGVGASVPERIEVKTP